MDKQPMSFILIEDNENECLQYQNYFLSRDDIKLVSVTNSSQQGIEDVKTYLPEAIILDMELNSGSGSGIMFLEELNKIQFKVKPLIAVITHISDTDTYNYVHRKGANFVVYKLREDYSPKLVVEDLFAMRKSHCSIITSQLCNNSNIESLAERRLRISNRINAELDKFSMRSNLKGRAFIHDAILYEILEEQKVYNMTAFQYIAKENKVKNPSNIGNNMQTAIEHSWNRIAPDELKKLYTLELDYRTCLPTPTEFISYLVNKIKKTL